MTDTINIDNDKNELKIQEQRKKSFNGLCASEWASLSRSVWNDVSSARAKKHLNHGATYPEKLCDRVISMYSNQKDVILDPFMGTGTTIISALKNKREAIGIELTDRFYNISNISINECIDSIKFNLFNKDCPKSNLIQGDCCEVLKNIANNSIQLTLTSPPYADLIHKVVKDRAKTHKNSYFVTQNNATTNIYSDDERDLGNMSLKKYLEKVEEIMQELFRVTRPGGYNAWVVKDYRDTKNKIPYVDLHSKIANAGQKAGFLYHDLIIWDQNQHRKLVLLGFPSVFYVNQNHSYIVIMRKPK